MCAEQAATHMVVMQAEGCLCKDSSSEQVLEAIALSVEKEDAVAAAGSFYSTLLMSYAIKRQAKWHRRTQ